MAKVMKQELNEEMMENVSGGSVVATVGVVTTVAPLVINGLKKIFGKDEEKKDSGTPAPAPAPAAPEYNQNNQNNSGGQLNNITGTNNNGGGMVINARKSA